MSYNWSRVSMKLGGIISKSKGEQTPSQRWRRIFREKCVRKQCFREITVGNCRRNVLKCHLAFCGAQDSTYSLAQGSYTSRTQSIWLLTRTLDRWLLSSLWSMCSKFRRLRPMCQEPNHKEAHSRNITILTSEIK